MLLTGTTARRNACLLEQKHLYFKTVLLDLIGYLYTSLPRIPIQDSRIVLALL